MQREELIRECEVFTRYLLRRPPNAYVIRRYCEYHAAFPEMGGGGDAFDRALTRFAMHHPLCVKVADAYSSRFCRSALLRRKLVLLLSLAEITPPFFHDIDSPDRLAPALIVVKLAAQGLAYAAALAIGVIVLGPKHAFQANGHKRSESVR